MELSGEPGISENRERLVQVCAERDLKAWNTNFKENVRKYTRVSGINGKGIRTNTRRRT